MKYLQLKTAVGSQIAAPCSYTMKLERDTNAFSDPGTRVDEGWGARLHE